jgi:hypothetical protein
LIQTYGETERFRIERGVNQVAELWKPEDGTQGQFDTFCLENFKPSGEALDQLFSKLERNFEVIWGTFLRMEMDLKVPLHLDVGPIDEVDNLFGAYSPAAHLNDDLFSNKVAMLVSLNFPFYSLEEKADQGKTWSRKQWAYARMGDLFTSRVPAEVYQNLGTVLTNADNYISNYNIYMGKLRDENGAKLFSDSLVLITHWNLRDELKSQYANPDGLVKQESLIRASPRWSSTILKWNGSPIRTNSTRKA